MERSEYLNQLTKYLKQVRELTEQQEELSKSIDIHTNKKTSLFNNVKSIISYEKYNYYIDGLSH